MASRRFPKSVYSLAQMEAYVASERAILNNPHVMLFGALPDVWLVTYNPPTPVEA